MYSFKSKVLYGSQYLETNSSMISPDLVSTALTNRKKSRRLVLNSWNQSSLQILLQAAKLYLYLHPQSSRNRLICNKLVEKLHSTLPIYYFCRMPNEPGQRGLRIDSSKVGSKSRTSNPIENGKEEHNTECSQQQATRKPCRKSPPVPFWRLSQLQR